MTPEELTQLVSAWKTGDQEAFSAIYYDKFTSLYHYFRGLTKDHTAAEELAQDTLLAAYQNISSLQEPAAFSGWLKKIAYHKFLRYCEKKQLVLVDENEDGSTIFDILEEDRAEFIPHEALDKKDLRDTLLDMLTGLPATQSTAMEMFYFEQMSIEQIAQVQDTSVNTVKSRLHYGKKAMKEAVSQYEKKHGIRLHTIAIGPLVAWALRAYAAQVPATAAVAAGGAVATVAAGSATPGTVGAATGGTAAATTGAASGTASAVGAKTAGTAIVTKIAAGVVAAGVAIGGATMGIKALKMPVSTTQPAIVVETEWTIPDEPIYESDTLRIYGGSDRYQQRLGRVLGNTFPQYLVTEDNQVYSPSEPGKDYMDGLDAREVFYGTNVLGFVDSQRVKHILIGEDTFALTDVKGDVVYAYWGFLDNIDVITLDGEQALYSIRNRDGTYYSLNEPYNLGTDSLGNENDKAQMLTFCMVQDILNNTAVYYAQDGNRDFIGAFDAYLPVNKTVRMDITYDGKPVDVKFVAHNETYGRECPILQVAGDTEHLYTDFGISGAELERRINLPQGYSVRDLKQVVCSKMLVLMFQDGTVYTSSIYSRSDEFEYEKNEELSKLGSQGHIVQVYLSNDTDDPMPVVLMDDNVLYKVTQ